MTLGVRNATATLVDATSTRETPSRATCTYRAVWTANVSSIVTASTRSADQKRERSPRSARFGWSPVVNLQGHHDRPTDPRSDDLRHLREQALIDTVRPDGRRDVAVVLTDRGRDLLEHHRDRNADSRQEFYAGPKHVRELEYDVQVYDAYLSVAERLETRATRTSSASSWTTS